MARATTSTKKSAVFPPQQQQPYQIIIQPARPTVVTLPAPDPGYGQLLAILALAVSLFTLFRNLSQKRGEHRAAFYHATVVDNSLKQIIEFHRELRELIEKELPQLTTSQDLQNIRSVMAEIRTRTAKVRVQTSSLVKLFDAELEQKIENAFDHVQDDVTNFLGAQIDQASRPMEQLFTIVANSQAEIIALVRDGEFRQGWPSIATRWQWVGQWWHRRKRSKAVRLLKE